MLNLDLDGLRQQKTKSGAYPDSSNRNPRIHQTQAHTGHFLSSSSSSLWTIEHTECCAVNIVYMGSVGRVSAVKKKTHCVEKTLPEQAVHQNGINKKRSDELDVLSQIRELYQVMEKYLCSQAFTISLQSSWVKFGGTIDIINSGGYNS